MLASVLPTVSAITTPDNRKFINCILILLKFIFDAIEYTLASYEADTVLALLLKREVNSLYFSLLLNLPVIV